MRFVLIDRFLEIVPGERAVAVKTFSPDEDFLEDHFPGFPVIPGALLAEAMGQTGGWLIAYGEKFRRWPLLTMIDGVKLRRFVRPGEEIRLSAAVRSSTADSYEVRGEAEVAGSRVAEGRFLFRAFEPSLAGEPSKFASWTSETAERLFRDL
jgi:3-hydroxyacyl-[acyl-carrier-protein] dehydratase